MKIYPPDHILVLGHRNPDTDASASAQGYAEFLTRSESYDSPVVAGVVGDLPPQSRFVFERAGAAPPPIIRSLQPRVCDVATRAVDTLSTDDRFRDAVEKLIRMDRSMLPVLDREGKLQSVFSHRRDVSRFLLDFDVVPLLGSLLSWDDLLELPGASALGTRPSNPALAGQLRLAVEGDGRWREGIGRDDLLVCGDLAVLGSLPEGSRPRWVVLVSGRKDSDPANIAAHNARGTSFLGYPHSASDFLFALMAQVRLGALDLGTGLCVGELDFLDDVREVVSSSRHALPVLNGDGRLVGVVSRTDLQAPPVRRVILVDHFESAQAVEGIASAEILEIIDHHRVGDIETRGPVRVDCRPVGSSSTIVALRFFERRLRPDRSTAALLLGGLLADTLALRSPTATAVDRDVARRLGDITGLEPETFGREVLRAGDDLLTADLSEIWSRDQKFFGIRNRTFAVAQLETVSLEDFPPERLEILRHELQRDYGRGKYLASLLFLTDVLNGDSWVTACESPPAAGLVASSYGEVHPRPGWTLARGIVSRKKQIVPALMRCLAERPL